MQVNIFRLIPWMIICPLIVALCVRECQHQKLKEVVNAPFDSTILIKQQLAVIQARGARQLKQIKQDSLKTSLALQALKIENKNLRKKLKELRPEVVRIADSIPVIEEWVNLSDSLDLIQNAELDSMRAERLRIWKSFNSIISIKDQELQIFKEIDHHNTALNKELRKQVRKERRKKTLFKIVSGVLVSVLIFEIVQN